eukprot:3306648-Pleurochrysis_carterae.AAC.2
MFGKLISAAATASHAEMVRAISQVALKAIASASLGLHGCDRAASWLSADCAKSNASVHRCAGMPADACGGEALLGKIVL